VPGQADPSLRSRTSSERSEGVTTHSRSWLFKFIRLLGRKRPIDKISRFGRQNSSGTGGGCGDGWGSCACPHRNANLYCITMEIDMFLNKKRFMPGLHILIYGGPGMLLLLAIAVRLSLYHIVTSDYTVFLSQWYDFISTHGGFAAFKYNFSNYNPPLQKHDTLRTLGTSEHALSKSRSRKQRQ
jgi:hypothetical protein